MHLSRIIIAEKKPCLGIAMKTAPMSSQFPEALFNVLSPHTKVGGDNAQLNAKPLKTKCQHN